MERLASRNPPLASPLGRSCRREDKFPNNLGRLASYCAMTPRKKKRELQIAHSAILVKDATDTPVNGWST